MLTLTQELDQPDFAYLAPQAAGNSWYPYSFLSPLAQNEPGLSSALVRLRDVVAQVEDAGIPRSQIMLLGFSQGACLSLELAARQAGRYGGVAALSGGLIGPAGAARNYAGNFGGTPIFLGCSDIDFHIPKERVQHTTELLGKMGAVVTEHLYPNMGHTINQDEITFVQNMMDKLV